MADETGGGSGEAANDNQPQAANDNQPGQRDEGKPADSPEADRSDDDGEPPEADLEDDDGEPPEADPEDDDREPPEVDGEEDDGEPPEDEDPGDDGSGNDGGDAANDNQPQPAKDNQPQPANDNQPEQGHEYEPADAAEDDDGEPPEDEAPDRDDEGEPADAAEDGDGESAGDPPLQPETSPGTEGQVPSDHPPIAKDNLPLETRIDNGLKERLADPRTRNQFPEGYSPYHGDTFENYLDKYTKLDADGKPSWDWPPNDDGAVKGTEMPTTLQPGEQFDRYGDTQGQFLSPIGTSYPERSLPADRLASEYHVYEVVKPIPAIESVTAPAFGEPGGGIQVRTAMTIQQLLDGKYLRVVL